MEVNNSDYTILIVDDVEANIFLLKLLISRAGYKTLTAKDGKEALEMIDKYNPDLILLDIMMPIMDGHEVARRLKNTPDKAGIPIIFLSALNSTEDIVQGFRLGAADYVSKPFNKDELLTRLNHQISLIYAKKTISAQTEELKKTIYNRDKLYSVIAHDLRSPIASIRMVMEVLVSRIPKECLDEDIYEMLITANRLTEDSFNLLDNLLKWAKSQTGRLNTVFQDDVDVMSVINGVVAVQQSVAKLKNIEINIIGSTNKSARLDIDMLKTSLRNLISNAIKFSFDNSEIDIVIKDENKRVVVDVIDRGTGISEDKKRLLFDSNSHFTSFGTGNEEGAGLGLLIAKEFITRIGGELTFKSQEGKGSTFSFSIPTR